MRSSLTIPPRIYEVRLPAGFGVIGFMACPGRREANAFTGAWLRDMDLDLDAIDTWNAAAVVSLIEVEELDFARTALIEKGVRARHMAWHHLALKRLDAPSPSFEAEWQASGNGLRDILRTGGNVLLHSMNGTDRAAMIAARVIVELGSDPADAIAQVRDARAGALETTQHVEHVMAQRPVAEAIPARGYSAVRGRAIGAMLGGVVGDALGAALEFRVRDSFLPVTDMIGGGPFDLEAGEWTDDTAMTLALADSLLACPALDEADLMDRFSRCYEDGAYSCTGQCFDIGLVTREALRRWKETGNPVAGTTDGMTAGNGSLVRIAPIIVRNWQERDVVRDLVARQSRTTHAASEAVDACVAFGEILIDAVEGQSRSFVLRNRIQPSAGSLAEMLAGSWRDKRRDQIESSAYVVYTLEAAIWCVSRSANFEDAVLLAANLGQDADTVCAVTGQLAGALYGIKAIPARWLEKIAWRERIEQTAERLFDQGAMRHGHRFAD